MSKRPALRIAGGTESSASKTFVSMEPSGSYVSTGIIDEHGNPYFKGTPPPVPPGGGGNDGSGPVKSLFSLDIPRDVQIAKWGLATLVVAFGSAFLYFIAEFNDVRKDISSIQSNVSAQTATVAAVQTTLERIEDKLDRIDDHTQGSPGTRQAEPVHSGTETGSRKP